MTTKPGLLIVLAIGAALVMGGCAGQQAGKGTADALGNVVGEVVTCDGTLSMRGSHPYPRLVLELEDGVIVQIESETLQAELQSLQGMRASIQGEALAPRDKAGTPVINASRYELLRLPTGELPLVGTVIILDGECLLTSREGRRFWMRGDLVPILREYEGERVWVVGSKGAAPNPPQGTEPYWVTGYGVLAQPEAGM